MKITNINFNSKNLLSKKDEIYINKFIADNPEIWKTTLDNSTYQISTDLLDNTNITNPESNESWIQTYSGLDNSIYQISTDLSDNTNITNPESNEPWIQTYSGKKFYSLNPREEDVDICDIARGLSMECRFNGQVKKFYSVAQHSVLVSYLCNLEDSLHGLLHDAAEAYISDFSAPLKKSGKFNNYQEIEDKLTKVIYSKFQLSPEEPISVKKADKMILATEARDVLNKIHKDWHKGKLLPFKIEPLNPKNAEKLFLDRFYELTSNNYGK